MKAAQGVSRETVVLSVPGRAGREAGSPEARLIRASWRALTSMRLALVLILLIAAVVLAGTLVDQEPGAVLADPAAHARWLISAKARYGLWAGVFDRTRMFDVFHSFWFRGLIGLLAANIVACSVNRWRGIWNLAFHTRVRMADAFFVHARHNAAFTTTAAVDEAAALVRRALKKSRYRVALDSAPGSVAIFGERNRLSRFGTFFSHLGLVLILLAAAAGSIWGQTDPGFVVPEGTTRSLGMGTSASVRLEQFADEYYPDGPPKDFRSDVAILEGGKQVKSGTIRVNSPMTYGGVHIHQSFYGQAAVINVRDKSGTVVFADSVPLAWQTQDGSRPVGSFTIPARGLTAYVVGPRSGADDPLIPAGEIRLETYKSDGSPLAGAEVLSQGQPKDLANLSFTFEREVRFAGFKLTKSPGVNVIWIASAFMVLGMVMLFYLPRRRTWALCNARPDGLTEVRLAMPAMRDAALTDEFDRLQKKVGQALGSNGAGSPSEEGE